MKKFFYFLAGALLIAGISILFICSVDKEKSTVNDYDKMYREAFAHFYKIFTVEVPAQADFAGEKVPLDDFWVNEALDRELMVNTYWHSNTLLMIKRANRYFPVIEPLLKDNGVPDDFKYLALVESGLENVVSPAGAAGFWQFLKSTAQSYGLEVGSEIDERYNLEKATVAACQFLKSAYSKYSSWTLAAASYNMGGGALDKELQIQGVNNYYDLYLNKETIRYVYRIVAVKTILQNPLRYGFYLREKNFYPEIPCNVVTVDSTVSSWPEFAKNNNSNYRILREMNPWIIKSSMTNTSKKTYEVKLPKEGYTSLQKLLDQKTYDDLLFNDTLRIEQIR